MPSRARDANERSREMGFLRERERETLCATGLLSRVLAWMGKPKSEKANKKNLHASVLAENASKKSLAFLWTTVLREDLHEGFVGLFVVARSLRIIL